MKTQNDPIDFGGCGQGCAACLVTILLMLAIWFTGCNGKVTQYGGQLIWSDWNGVKYEKVYSVPLSVSSPAAVRAVSDGELERAKWRVVSGRNVDGHGEDHQYASSTTTYHPDCWRDISGLDGRDIYSDAGQCDAECGAAAFDTINHNSFRLPIDICGWKCDCCLPCNIECNKRDFDTLVRRSTTHRRTISFSELRSCSK